MQTNVGAEKALTTSRIDKIAHQGVLWNKRKRGQEASMDCDRYLRADRHRQKAFELGSDLL